MPLTFVVHLYAINLCFTSTRVLACTSYIYAHLCFHTPPHQYQTRLVSLRVLLWFFFFALFCSYFAFLFLSSSSLYFPPLINTSKMGLECTSLSIHQQWMDFYKLRQGLYASAVSITFQDYLLSIDVFFCVRDSDIYTRTSPHNYTHTNAHVAINIYITIHIQIS